jgi:16S rRNA (guanine1207-N2)-methyltransferase
MSASLLPADSAAAHRSRDLLAEFPHCAMCPGCRRRACSSSTSSAAVSGELDVSGRDAAGAFIDAEGGRGGSRIDIIVIDDARGTPGRLLSASPRWPSITIASTSPALPPTLPTLR